VKNLTALKAKRYGVYTCQPQTTLREATRIMVAEDISALVVVDDDGCLEGIITRVDLMRVRYHQEDWNDKPVGSAMSSEVVTVSQQDTLEKVMALLLERHIHRVVVVRQEKTGLFPVSVLSAADILYHMDQES
jgi:signal-transduction protein with cAMP-binding, CBS, and nucleotidyltransferase domain